MRANLHCSASRGMGMYSSNWFPKLQGSMSSHYYQQTSFIENNICCKEKDRLVHILDPLKTLLHIVCKQGHLYHFKSLILKATYIQNKQICGNTYIVNSNPLYRKINLEIEYGDLENLLLKGTTEMGVRPSK